MISLNDVDVMAIDYVNQVYKHPISETQRQESQQHFIMGIWAMLQLAKQMPPERIDTLEKELIDTLEKELRECQIKRVKELEEKARLQ